MANQYLIWWTTQEECEAIGERLPKGLPVYLRDEYRSRWGRPGRGRLWASHLVLITYVPTIAPWPETPLGRHLAAHAGGIVIQAEDAPLLVEYPGMITDLRVRRWDGG